MAHTRKNLMNFFKFTLRHPDEVETITTADSTTLRNLWWFNFKEVSSRYYLCVDGKLFLIDPYVSQQRLKDFGIRNKSNVWAIPIRPLRYTLSSAVRNIVKAIDVPPRHPGAPMSEAVRKELLFMQFFFPIVPTCFSVRFPDAEDTSNFRVFCETLEHCDRVAAENRQRFARRPTRDLKFLIRQYNKYEKYKYCIDWCQSGPEDAIIQILPGPFVVIQLGSERTAAVVDDSIEYSAIPMVLAKKIKYTTERTVSNVQGQGGIIHNVKIHVTEVIMQNASFWMNFTISNTHNESVVIGREFLRLYGYTIDFYNNELIAQDHSIPFIITKKYTSITRKPAAPFLHKVDIVCHRLCQLGFQPSAVKQALEYTNRDIFDAYKLLKYKVPQYLCF